MSIDAFALNMRAALDAQVLATTARLAMSLEGGEESVPVQIAADGFWTFTLSCQMKRSDLEDRGNDELVIDLLMTGILVERLQRSVELMIKMARSQIAQRIRKA
jgi:hypothetical protein